MRSQPTSGPAGDQLAAMGEGAEPPGADNAGESQDIHIPSESLPPGLKEGDCLRCTGMDQSGGTFTLEAAGDKSEEGTPWEEDFRAAMSPDAPQEGAS